MLWNWDAVLACPRCRGGLTRAADWRCRCGDVGRLADDRLFVVEEADDAMLAILAWPDEFVRSLPGWAEALAAGAEYDRGGPRRHGLTDATGALTPLGLNVQYHLDEHRWQRGRKGLDGVLDLAAVGPTVRALDVGCGAAQTLRRLEPDRPAELFGIDRDGVAVALGARLARAEGIDVGLARGAATRLPFRDASFDLVLTRVALNYMHQPTAVAEMARVLRPGGYLFCRVERVWHDLRGLRHAPGVKAFVCRLRDLGWGAVHAVTGWQPVPGPGLRGARAFASAGRLRRALAPLGCRVTRAVESPNGPELAGRRTQLIVVARKEGA